MYHFTLQKTILFHICKLTNERCPNFNMNIKNMNISIAMNGKFLQKDMLGGYGSFIGFYLIYDLFFRDYSDVKLIVLS